MPNRFRAAALRALPVLLVAPLPALPAIAPAQAHAVLEPKEASPNAFYRGVVRIMHGCEGAPTTRVTVTIPEGVAGAKPMPKPGWAVATTRAAYAKPYQTFHGKASEGVNAITWSGGPLGDDEVDEFTFFARVSDDFAPGTTVYFPVEQDCAKGPEKSSIAWSEIPAEGQDAHALKTPAPGVRIVPAKLAERVPETVAAKTGDKTGAKGAAPATVGDLAIVTPWLRATPNGAKVAGGYVTVSNAGKEPDRLTGAAIPQAGRAEIHSMSMEGGVMKMGAVEGGLAIEPGGSVALKPGGYHLMFLDLKDGLKAGESVQGSLTFARAGTVPVTFTVAPIGAQGPTERPGGAAASAGDEHQHGHQH